MMRWTSISASLRDVLALAAISSGSSAEAQVSRQRAAASETLRAVVHCPGVPSNPRDSLPMLELISPPNVRIRGKTRQNLLFALTAMICVPAAPQSGSGNEAIDIAYCVAALERSAAVDQQLIAAAGENVALRAAAADSFAQHQRSLSELRERLTVVPDQDAHTTSASTQKAHADHAAFSSHYEVCWNYCSNEEVGSAIWQGCISRCRKADPLITRLDLCRALD